MSSDYTQDDNSRSKHERNLNRDKHAAVFPYVTESGEHYVYYLGGAPLLETFEAWNKVDVKMIKYKSIVDREVTTNNRM